MEEAPENAISEAEYPSNCFMGLSPASKLHISHWSKLSELTFFRLFVLLPNIITGQSDMLPPKGGQMMQKIFVHAISLFFHCFHSALDVNSIPKYDSSSN